MATSGQVLRIILECIPHEEDDAWSCEEVYDRVPSFVQVKNLGKKLFQERGIVVPRFTVQLDDDALNNMNTYGKLQELVQSRPDAFEVDILLEVVPKSPLRYTIHSVGSSTRGVSESATFSDAGEIIDPGSLDRSLQPSSAPNLDAAMSVTFVKYSNVDGAQSETSCKLYINEPVMLAPQVIGKAMRFVVNKELPMGLEFHPTSGCISGVPRKPMKTESQFRITAFADDESSASTDLLLQVLPGLMKTIVGPQENLYGPHHDSMQMSLSNLRGLCYHRGILYFVQNHSIFRADLRAERPEAHCIAGKPGSAGFSGDGGPAVTAQLNNPYGLCVKNAGHELYVADSNNNRVRKVDLSTGIIQTVAGVGSAGYGGDGAAATGAALNFPIAVSVSQDRLYISDSCNHRIRVVNLVTGIVSTLAGTGSQSFSGDGGDSTRAHLNYPRGLLIHQQNLYVADYRNNRVRCISLNGGRIETLVGGGDSSIESTPGKEFRLNSPIALAASGNKLFVSATSCIYEVEMQTDEHRVFVAAGTGSSGFDPGSKTATASRFGECPGLAADRCNLYLSDDTNKLVRMFAHREDADASVPQLLAQVEHNPIWCTLTSNRVFLEHTVRDGLLFASPSLPQRSGAFKLCFSYQIPLPYGPLASNAIDTTPLLVGLSPAAPHQCLEQYTKLRETVNGPAARSLKDAWCVSRPDVESMEVGITTVFPPAGSDQQSQQGELLTGEMDALAVPPTHGTCAGEEAYGGRPFKRLFLEEKNIITATITKTSVGNGFSYQLKDLYVNSQSVLADYPLQSFSVGKHVPVRAFVCSPVGKPIRLVHASPPVLIPTQ